MCVLRQFPENMETQHRVLTKGRIKLGNNLGEDTVVIHENYEELKKRGLV